MQTLYCFTHLVLKKYPFVSVLGVLCCLMISLYIKLASKSIPGKSVDAPSLSGQCEYVPVV